MSKDWIRQAAEELASHFSFGGGRDNYVTDEYERGEVTSVTLKRIKNG